MSRHTCQCAELLKFGEHFHAPCQAPAFEKIETTFDRWIWVCDSCLEKCWEDES